MCYKHDFVVAARKMFLMVVWLKQQLLIDRALDDTRKYENKESLFLLLPPYCLHSCVVPDPDARYVVVLTCECADEDCPDGANSLCYVNIHCF